MIRVEHLQKTFGAVKAVDDVSFEVKAGEIFAFLGPNGAGKTTTIQMLTTLLTPTAGRVTLDDLDPRTHAHEVRTASCITCPARSGTSASSGSSGSSSCGIAATRSSSSTRAA
jgi:ABC-type multidrug transport system ATPase subunit